jgi:hypothetical protein
MTPLLMMKILRLIGKTEIMILMRAMSKMDMLHSFCTMLMKMFIVKASSMLRNIREHAMAMMVATT